MTDDAPQIDLTLDAENSYDLEFFFDPVCPFAWQTSRWIRRVAELRGLSVNWRFICLRIINETKNYETDFPSHYVAAHDRGRSLLRVCAAVRADHGPGPVGLLYEDFGTELWGRTSASKSWDGVMSALSNEVPVAAILERHGLDAAFAAAADDDAWDVVLREESELAFSRTGPDVGTPIITFDPPEGNSFFGPVISTLPGDEDALELFDAVRTMARFPSFSELKRTKREPLDLPLLTMS